MMFSTAVLIGILLLSVLLSVLAYVRLRRLTDVAFGLAIDLFYNSIDSIMETPDDIPESLLEFVGDLNAMVQNSHEPQEYYRFLKAKRKGDLPSSSSATKISSDLNSLRPELRELFARMMFAMIQIVRNRSVFYGILIELELETIRVKEGKLVGAENDVKYAFKIIPHSSPVPQGI